MRRAILIAGLILPPVAWFVSLESNFSLAPLACAQRGTNILLLVSVAALAIAIVGGVFAWTQRGIQRRLAFAGIVISAFCSLVIVAQTIPTLMLGGCE